MPTRIQWEGSFFANHSLGLVNRELVGRLALRPELAVTIASEEKENTLGWDAERIAQLRALECAPAGPVDVCVRHRWPLDPVPPATGKWVIFQPWEFGSIPREWYEPMRFGADEVWVYSSFNRDCYVESGIPEEKIRVVPLGVHASILTPPSPFPLRTRKRFKFLFVGGTILRKGIDLLLDAYTRGFTREDDVCLVVKDFGVGTYYRNQTYDRFIRKLQSDPRMPEIEYISADLTSEQMRDLYHACDCLVHPYRGEGFGLPIAEAMGCGLPVVVPEHGGASDFCTPETAVLLPARRAAIPASHARSLATVAEPWWTETAVGTICERMREVYARPETFREVAERGRMLIREGFTWEVAAERVGTGVLSLDAGREVPTRSDAAQQSRLRADAGAACWKRGDREGAIHHFSRAWEEREDEDVLFNLAVLAIEGGDLAGGRALLEHLRARLDPEVPAQLALVAETENLLGVCHSSAGELARAREHFTSALALAPDLDVAAQNLSELAVLEGAPAGAVV